MIYINRNPFVIRNALNPMQNIKTYQGISTNRLEQMENRLKDDIISEMESNNGMVLVHEEREGQLVPVWLAPQHIQTSREVFETLAEQGFHVSYVRIPISPEQAPEDRYIDEYVKVLKSSSLEDSLIFNCGIGVGRSNWI